MIARAWYLLAALWAVVAFGIFASDASDTMSIGFLAIALGPLAAPFVLGRLARFVLTGSARRRPVVRVYRPK